MCQRERGGCPGRCAACMIVLAFVAAAPGVFLLVVSSIDDFEHPMFEKHEGTTNIIIFFSFAVAALFALIGIVLCICVCCCSSPGNQHTQAPVFNIQQPNVSGAGAPLIYPVQPGQHGYPVALQPISSAGGYPAQQPYPAAQPYAQGPQPYSQGPMPYPQQGKEYPPPSGTHPEIFTPGPAFQDRPQPNAPGFEATSPPSYNEATAMPVKK